MGVKLVSASAGSVEIVAPATASNYTATMPAGSGTVAVNGVSGTLVSGTAVASTSGTSIDFTGIPSWVKRITVMFSGVSTNYAGSSNLLLQIGTSGGVQTTGYSGSAGYFVNAGASAVANFTAGVGVVATTAANSFHGAIVFTLTNNATGLWAASYTLGRSDGVAVHSGGATKTLSGTLDRVRITTVNGTDTFDAGSINILYE